MRIVILILSVTLLIECTSKESEADREHSKVILETRKSLQELNESISRYTTSQRDLLKALKKRNIEMNKLNKSLEKLDSLLR